MVRLNRIYTRTGDAGTTGLSTGERVSKGDLRVRAFGDVDECNAAIGLARLHAGEDAALDALLERIQNELFDLGADLATPDDPERPVSWEPLRIIDGQVERLEHELNALNDALEPLKSFVLPAGTALATHLHLARTVCRRAERSTVVLAESGGQVGAPALHYLNRLSDLLFVASRHANVRAGGDVLWRPGATR